MHGAGCGRCLSWVLLGALGCTPWERPTAADEAAAPACAPLGSAQRLPVVTTLVTRDHEVTVLASDDGLRFTVMQADGARLGTQLTAHEFERDFPALHQRFDSAFAGDDLWLDASIHGSAEPPSR